MICIFFGGVSHYHTDDSRLAYAFLGRIKGQADLSLERCLAPKLRVTAWLEAPQTSPKQVSR